MAKGSFRAQWVLSLFWLSVVLLAVCGKAHAQSAGVFVRGTAQDQSGAVLAGVVVTLRSFSGTRLFIQNTTDRGGRFEFGGVSAGTYEIQAAPRGFVPAVLRIHVAQRPVRNLRLVLKLAAVEQQVTVKAEPGHVDTEAADNRDAIVLNHDALKNLPVFDQNPIAMLSRFLDTGDLGAGGVTLIVDGVEAKKVGVAPSAIRSIKIGDDPYSAAFARPGRGRIEVETDAGDPEFHGEFAATFRDSSLNARNAFAPVRPFEQRRILEGSLTGPLGHGKTNTFEMSMERAIENTQAIVFAMGVNGPIHQIVPTPNHGTQIEALIDHQGSPKNDISLRFTLEDQSSVNQGVGGLTLAEAAASSHDREEQLIYHQRTLVNSHWINQFRVRLGHDWNPSTSLHDVPRIEVQGAFIAGGAQANGLDAENHVTGADSMTWMHGRHTVMGGIDVPDWSNHRYDNFNNFGGTFFFDNLQDYILNRPFLYTRQQGNGHLEILRKLLGLYVQDQIQLRPNLTVTAGLRYDWQNHFPERDNFAPRLSFAAALGKRRDTVIRGGIGIFYDRFGDDQIAEFLHYNGTGLRQYILTNPGYPDPLGSGQSLAAQPTTLEQFAPGIKIPYIVESNLAIEHQVGKATLTANYIFARSISLFLSRDVNAPLPPFYQQRPNPAVGQLRQIESAGRGVRDSLQLTLRGRILPLVSGLLQYTWGRFYDNTDGVGFFPANQFSFQGEWGRANFDQRHRFDLAETWSPGAGFNLGAVLALYSGQPYTVTLGKDPYNDGMSNARPAGVSRNSRQGPGYAALDLDLSRDFALRRGGKDDGPKFNLSLAAFNILNRVNFNRPVGNLQSPFFGQSISASPARRLQVGLRFEF